MEQLQHQGVLPDPHLGDIAQLTWPGGLDPGKMCVHQRAPEKQNQYGVAGRWGGGGGEREKGRGEGCGESEGEEWARREGMEEDGGTTGRGVSARQVYV